MEHEIRLVRLDEQRILSIRHRVQQVAIPEFIANSIDDLLGRLALLGADPTGPPFVAYHEFGPHGIDAEVCIPVPESVRASGAMLTRTMPPMTVARALHVGPYDRLGAAYQAVNEWVDDHHLTIVGPFHERYLNSPGDVASPADYLTEIDVPVDEARVATPA